MSSPRAQCGLEVDYFGYPGIDRSVWDSTMWDPDGAGPLTPLVAFAGQFYRAGKQNADGVTAWDPNTGEFVPLATPPQSGSFTAYTVHAGSSGNLYAGGWPGMLVQWSGGVATTLAIDSSPNGIIFQVLELPNGDVLVGGDFTSINGVAAQNVARWDGAAWHPLGQGLTNPSPTSALALVNHLVLRPNGDVLATGNFSRSGSMGLSNAALWDGSSSRSPPWNALSSGARVYQDSTGALTAVVASSVDRLLELQGGSWVNVATASGGFIRDVLPLGGGRYVLIGDFTLIEGIAVQQGAVFDGTTWSTLFQPGELSGFRRPRTVTGMPGGDVFVAGEFVHPTGSRNVVRRNAAGWQPMGAGLTATLLEAVASGPDGKAYVAGSTITHTGGSPTSIVRWDGSTLESVGPPANGSIYDLLVRAPNDIIAVGSFATFGTTTAYSVAHWDGVAWQPMGLGLNNLAWDVSATPAGDVVVGGRFTRAGNTTVNGVASFDGTSWSPFGTGLQLTNPGDEVRAVDARGPSYVGGQFQLGGTTHHVAELGPSGWAPLGTGVNGEVWDLQVLPNGDLIVCGDFTMAGGVPVPQQVARWDGSNWSGVGPAAPVFGRFTRGLGLLPNGDLLVVGTGISAGAVMRFDGTSWSPLVPYTGIVSDPVFDDDLGLLVTGQFSGTTFPFGRIYPTCPATEDVVPTTCIGPAGPMQLTATSLPWLDGAYTAVCDGFANTALGASVFGFGSPGTPLANLHPSGLPGCDLLADDVAVRLLMPTAGSVEDGFTVPATNALIGVTVYHQVLQVEPAGASIVTISGSNALRLTVGSF